MIVSMPASPRFFSVIRVALLLAIAVAATACSDDAEPVPDEPSGVSSTTSTPASTSPEVVQVDVGDRVFDAVVAGPEDGTVVFLLHGFPQTNQSWDDEVPVLADAGYRVIAPNLRGYSPGARPADPARYAMPELVGDVLGIADALEVEDFHVVGHDWGAMVTWNLGIEHPDRVLSIVPISVPHPLAFRESLSSSSTVDVDGNAVPSQTEMSRYMAVFAAEGSEEKFLADDAAFLRGIYSGPGFTDDEIDTYVDHFRAGDDAMTGPLNWYRGANQGTSIDPVTIPTMFIWSTEDTALGRTGAELAGDFVEGPYRFEILDGISHWIPDEAPDQLNKLLLEHLSTRR